MIESRGGRPLSVVVIIPAYTMARWELIKKAVSSAQSQTYAAQEVILCVDNSDELLQRSQQEWPGSELGTPVRIVANGYRDHLLDTAMHMKAHGTSRRFGAGSARNFAAENVSADVLAFLDDDAWAEPDWLQELLAVYSSTSAVAVGGAPLPDFATARPAWFPGNFDWVFGCAYEGLPTSIAPLGHLIGANMSVRSDALKAVGGFHSVDFDDLDLCMRLGHRFGTESVYYTPRAVVHHYVSAERVSWQYFYRRCFYVNREKVHAFRAMGSAANLASERRFVLRAFGTQVRHELGRMRSRDMAAAPAVGAMIVGILFAAAGHLRGRLDRRR